MSPASAFFGTFMSYPSLLKVRHELPPLYKMAERLRDDRGRFDESTPEKEENDKS